MKKENQKIVILNDGDVPSPFEDFRRLFPTRGFTLIELLVVVLIIGVLAAVAVPQYKKAVEKSRTVKALSILNSLEKAVDLYILENGFPNDPIDVSQQLSIDLPNYTSRPYAGLYTLDSFVYYIQCYSSACDIRAYRTNDVDGAYEDVAYNYKIKYIKSASTGAWSKSYIEGKSYIEEGKSCTPNLKPYFREMGFSVSDEQVYTCI